MMPENIQSLMQSLLENVRTTDYWWQILALATAVAVSAIVNRRLQQLLQARSESSIGLRHIAVRSLQRLLWPLVALALVLPARAVLHRYELPSVVLDVASPVLTALAVVRFSVYLMRKAFTQNALLRSSENILAISIWLVVIFHLLGWLNPVLAMLDSIAITLGESRVSVLSALNLLLIVAFAFIVALWLAEVVNRQVQRMPGVTPSFKVGVSKFSRFLLITLAFLLALNAVGINLSSLAIFGGALGVGLGFGLQRIASNFISGFILVLDRSIKPGDVITVGDKFGWVQELNARYIVVRNREGVDTLIPNENLITSEVINWSYADPNVRLTIAVQISYDDDPEEAMALMLECAKASPRVLAEPPPSVRLTQFADSGIELQLRVWIADANNGFAPVKSDVNLAIWRAFKQADITIPYPQRDLHIRSASADVLGNLKRPE
ncbi:mechanosensitive ion channel family protein [Pseudohongiella spirulinae]|uniref:Mechanosensitive ion channel protein MscS n=1 Tax=Pseudohongiella spirulinae TaxID=1249552 RepID=A0A0S2KD01_9GAMM|nr:mechanosensitive ion channel domain-containing protein [Pseudohongiella spirulinae]ALO46189.1 mechanosensitive ion channel protein MscS [Pseudohongiella spirulinae]